MDPTVVMEGGAASATALGLARFRPRRTRIRREPIDLEQLAVELAEPAPIAVVPPSVAPVVRSEQEILVALEAEVARVKAARAVAPPIVEPVAETVTVPVPVPAMMTEAVARPTTAVGLPLDQVRTWLDQVEEDLRRVEARVEYLQAEQLRLQCQHQLVAELISSSTPV